MSGVIPTGRLRATRPFRGVPGSVQAARCQGSTERALPDQQRGTGRAAPALREGAGHLGQHISFRGD
jgi:hypothetical protein